MNKIKTSLLIILLVFSSMPLALAHTQQASVHTFSEHLQISTPLLQTNNQGDLKISIPETDTYTTTPGEPHLPTITKTYTYPLGTTIDDITITAQHSITQQLNQTPQPTPYPQEYSSTQTINLPEPYTKNIESYTTTTTPQRLYTTTLGAGQVDGCIQTLLTITIHPITYNPTTQHLNTITEAELHISYTLPADRPIQPKESYDLLIITPSTYTEDLRTLVNHKESVGIHTKVLTLAEIESYHYQGRDQTEQIKYAIKDHVETYAIPAVLLIGNIDALPIRTTHVKIMNFHIHQTLSDLYYADLYNADGTFSSWDTNQDDKFSESGVDIVDLYPDIQIGRLPVNNRVELHNIIDKIICYETETYDSDWYHTITYIGGDTFPGLFDFTNEGEDHNELVMEVMTDFTARDIIWTSKGNFNKDTINAAINQGCGFVDYSGHGFEHGMGTYTPRKERQLQSYFTPYIHDLQNGNKLPIIFFDACLTAKLDFTLQDMIDYKAFRPLQLTTRHPLISADNPYDPYASAFLKQPNGGAIATIGATRTAFGGPTFGCEKLSLDYYKAYNTSITLGEMFLQAQITYRNDLPDDEFTIEEFILLGDPTLRLGGYTAADQRPTPAPSSPLITFQNPHKGYTYNRGEAQHTIHIYLYFLADCILLGDFTTSNPLEIKATDDHTPPEQLEVSLRIDDNPPLGLAYDPIRQAHTYIGTIPYGLHTYTATVTDTDGRSDITATTMLRLL